MNDQALQKVIDSFDELRRLMANADSLRIKLRRSLVLLQLFGEGLFAHGGVKTRVIGNAHTDLVFEVELGNGEKRKRPLEDMPIDFWPASVIAEIRGKGKYGRILKEAAESERRRTQELVSKLQTQLYKRT